MKIVIAEDDTASRFILEDAIEALGHPYLSVEDGRQAWEALQQHTDVDVVISDWLMPGLNGLELCGRLRARSAAGDSYIYFIMLTGLSEKQKLLEAMQAGADDFLHKPLDRTDLAVTLKVAQRFTSLYREVAAQRAAVGREKAEVERLNRELFAQARTDPLTQVGNRLGLREALEGLRSRVERYNHSYAVALFDVDHFKLYNDHYGHLMGDDVLRAVGGTIKSSGRTGDSVYRFGGEEFLVVLPEQTRESAALAGERLRQVVRDLAIEHTAQPGGGTVTISVGIAVLCRQQEVRIDQVLKEADAALYRSKREGRDRVSVYDSAVDASALGRDGGA